MRKRTNKSKKIGYVKMYNKDNCTMENCKIYREQMYQYDRDTGTVKPVDMYCVENYVYGLTLEELHREISGLEYSLEGRETILV